MCQSVSKTVVHKFFPFSYSHRLHWVKNFENCLKSRTSPSRSKFYNIAIVLWILKFENISYHIYKFWARKLQNIYSKPIGLKKSLKRIFEKFWKMRALVSDKILCQSVYIPSTHNTMKIGLMTPIFFFIKKKILTGHDLYNKFSFLESWGQFSLYYEHWKYTHFDTKFCYLPKDTKHTVRANAM